ncbi:MAG: alpha/beta hydrolase [Chloroflexi bacterium]|nr:alpha/beta hydrolase [Chloroflexota bacterium]
MSAEQLTSLIQMLRARPIEGGSPSVQEMRAGFEGLAATMPVPADVRREQVSAGGVPAEWVVAPGADEDRAILYLHGGGYVIGSIATHRELASRISRASGAKVLVIDYRLAPEHPFPAAVEDAAAAYRWLLEQGVAPERLAVAGDSAGGGLTLATLVKLREDGTPLPAAGVCLSPWTDLEGIGESMTSRAEQDPIVAKGGLDTMAKAYVGDADLRSPLAAPLYAELGGLPPLLIQVGTAEVLYDDSTRFTERARAAGVDVTLEPWQDMIHVWQVFAAMLDEGQQAIDRIGEFVRQKTATAAAQRS